MLSRRSFLISTVASGLGVGACRLGVDLLAAPAASALGFETRFTDLRRHFVFEYYAWYGMAPIEHWDQDDRHPPVDLASNYMPRLGAYDSKSRKIIEQHAKWIADSGVGAINLSWWGRDSDVDKLVPTLMDIMAAHDVHVTFHIEPYRPHHAGAYAEDVEYLIRRYGDQRRWDCLLRLRNENGARGPVFKSFRTIVPETVVDCRGRTFPVEDYAEDSLWRQQTDRLRATFAKDFDHITLLADSLDVLRTKASGFDGIAIYDNYVRPRDWATHARRCTDEGLVFSFNVNPGFDGIVRRRADADSCYQPPAVEPDSIVDWSSSAGRAAAAEASRRRILESFSTTTSLQADETLINRKRGFFLVYVNSFNEWHEGHQFEPARDDGDLTAAERRIGYHNPRDGFTRLKTLKGLLARAGVKR